MLEEVVRPDGSTVSFKYDALGRRIEKRLFNRKTRWVWDGNVPLHEWSEIYTKDFTEEKGEFYTMKPSKTTTWLFEEGTFVPNGKLIDNESFSIQSNYLGTPEVMYNADGKVVWSAELDAYGDVQNLTGERTDCSFAFQGMYFDKETNLCYNRFRYYSPEIGNYISQDPIGLLGGANLYGYVNDISFFIDPLGLKGMPKGGWNYGNMHPIKNMELHHVIPKSQIDHPAVKAAGFDVNKPSNLIYLPKEHGGYGNRSSHKGYSGDHSKYNKSMRAQLDEISRTGKANKWTKKQYQDAIEGLRSDTRKGLRNGTIKCK